MEYLILPHWFFLAGLLMLAGWAITSLYYYGKKKKTNWPIKRVITFVIGLVLLFTGLIYGLKGLAAYGVALHFWVLVSGCFLLGLASQWAASQFIRHTKEEAESLPLPWFCLVLVIAVALSSTAVILLFPSVISLLSILATPAFLLPFFLLHAFDQYLGIPERLDPHWTMSNQGIPVLPDGKKVKLRMKVTNLPVTDELTSPHFMIPERMSLGDMYDYFTVKYNHGQQLPGQIPKTLNGQPTRWTMAKLLANNRKRVLDPTKSLVENKLKDEDYIEAKLVTTPTMQETNSSAKNFTQPANQPDTDSLF